MARPGAGISAFCSATLIAPRVAVSAAHCFPTTENESSGLVDSDMRYLVVTFGADYATGQRIPVVAVHPHPMFAPHGYDSNEVFTHENDIALLYLGADAPVAPIPLFRPGMAGLAAGTSVTLVGFGGAGSGGFGGQRRSGTATIDQVFDRVFHTTAAPSATCTGDSGGAALISVGGVEYLAGVNYKADCATQSIETRVDAFYDSLIAPYLASAHAAECGNGACEVGESAAACPGDCCDATAACTATYRDVPGGYACRQVSGVSANPWVWIQPGSYRDYLCSSGAATCPACATSPSCVVQACGGSCVAGTGNSAGSGSGCTVTSAPVTDIDDLLAVPGAVGAIDDSLMNRWMTPCSGTYAGITFCPHETVTRGEAATILVRALYGDDFGFTGTPWMPTDVAPGDWRLRYIQKAFEVGLVHGTSSTTYAPDEALTRGQMAALIVRAWSLEQGYAVDGFPPASCAHPLFGDVPRTSAYFPYVQKLRELGITSGTGADPLTFSPDGSSERWQVAVFVQRALGNAAPAPPPCCPDTECTASTCGQLIPVSCTNTGGSTHIQCGPC